ncbi:hypothetical protein MTO96_026942 [Rhipicephalus appendiculatus]
MTESGFGNLVLKVVKGPFDYFPYTMTTVREGKRQVYGTYGLSLREYHGVPKHQVDYLRYVYAAEAHIYEDVPNAERSEETLLAWRILLHRLLPAKDDGATLRYYARSCAHLCLVTAYCQKQVDDHIRDGLLGLRCLNAAQMLVLFNEATVTPVRNSKN